MSLALAMLAEFEHEAKTTRKFLEQVPNDKLTWKPHEKSHTVGELALHIANVPRAILQLSSVEQSPIPDFSKLWIQPQSVQEILSAHDESADFVRKELPRRDDASLQKNWSAIANGKPVMTMPKAALLRFIMLNHWIHHRGQLGVYLRLLGAKVPSSYGPSGDEI
jgi:uncharacterized damage-inducible protein DinB